MRAATAWSARWTGMCLVAAGTLWAIGNPGTASVLATVAALPAIIAMLAPRPFRHLPREQRRWARRNWTQLCRDAHLTERRIVTTTSRWNGERIQTEQLLCPELADLRTSDNAWELTVRARSGQTLAELEAGAERIASIFDAAAFRTSPLSGSTLVIELVLRDLLSEPATAAKPDPVSGVAAVRLGRTQAGRPWLLPITGRHTLCVGASGSGKGSVLWGICCGLAPQVQTDTIRLWGIDLKRGVELAMGAPLFSALAVTPERAVVVLRALVNVIGERGDAMAGATRQHTPTPGDPLHVLVVDELAAMTAYAPSEIRREAERLLATILTQGRALGVIVVAFVQDPRKEVVSMRGLFTQTLALRLRSGEETSMVLGDGMARLAPAHRIGPSRPGTGCIVEDTGAVDRVRADYWPDQLIRDVAGRFPTPVRIELPADIEEQATRGKRAREHVALAKESAA